MWQICTKSGQEWSLLDHRTDQCWTPSASDVSQTFVDQMGKLLSVHLSLRRERELSRKKKLERWLLEEKMRRWKKQRDEAIEAERFRETLRQQVLAQPQTTSPLQV